MTEKLELYKCKICSNLVEVVLDGMGVLVCCGEDMNLLTTETTDGKLEFHVPVVEAVENGRLIKVGKEPHPTLAEHHIEFIEAISNDEKYVKRKYLEPNENPELMIKCLNSDDFSAREYCNIHGLYKDKKGEN